MNRAGRKGQKSDFSANAAHKHRHGISDVIFGLTTRNKKWNVSVPEAAEAVR
jgi:hypothetical protein